MEIRKMDNNTTTSKNIFENKHAQKYLYPVDLAECKRSNILISGTNQQGKSLLAMAISDILMNEGWRMLAFDSVGHWSKKSSVPNYLIATQKNMEWTLTDDSLIYDISRLLPFFQREYLEVVLSELWNYAIEQQPEYWTLIVLEEAHLYCRYIRGLVSQNLMRMASVGSNWKIRILAISPSLTGLDSEFIRLCQQRHHFRLGNELNSKRRMRAFYGLDYTRIALSLPIGTCLYYLNEKLTICSLPLFKSNTKPQPLKRQSWFEKYIYNKELAK